MLSHFLKAALRNFSRNKFYVLINITGLAIGVAGFLILGVYVQSEWSFDQFHEKGDRIYRVVETQRLPGVEEMDVAITMPPLAPLMKQDFPEIEHTVRMTNGGTQRWKHKGQTYTQPGFMYADSSLFDIFSFSLLAGDEKTALVEPYSLVLTQSVSKRIFGSENPVGKQLPVLWNGREYPFEITGVMDDVPEKSHIQFTMVASLTTYESFGNNFDEMWGNSMMTYLLLNKQADADALESKFASFLDRVVPESSVWADDRLDLYLQPLDEIHLQSGHIKYEVQNFQQGDLSTIYIFGFVSILIIVVASINYMNLATARSVKRSEEVGIRKVFGSQKESLIMQFLVESVVIATVATILGLVAASYLMPYFSDVMEVGTSMSIFDSQYLLIEIIAISLTVGLLAGSYPAFVLSSFRPADIIRGNYYHSGGGALLRKILVGAQFTVVVVLLIVSGYVWNQINYVLTKDVGFERNNVLYVTLSSHESRDKIPLLKQELNRLPNVEGVTASTSTMPGGTGDRTIRIPDEETPRKLLVRNTVVDPDYVETMEMKIVIGRNFNPSVGTDTTSAVLVNEALVQKLGWENPIGKQLEWGSEEDPVTNTVIGVLKNFHYFSFKESIDPLMMRAREANFPRLLVRVKPGNIQAALDEMKSAWSTLLPGQSFDYQFLDEHIASFYQSDRNYGKLITGFSTLAIIIACLGLLGIATFMAEQKTKEIGIRKVLGSSVSKIILLINKPFLKLVGISILISIPIGYWLGNQWLQIFRYYDEPGLWIYAAAALAVIAISYLTVSIQAYKAANLNPVDALQSE